MMLMLAQACVNVLVLVTFDTWNCDTYQSKVT